MKHAIVALVLGLVFIGCTKNGAATITCHPLQNYSARIGNVNTPHMDLGTLAYVNDGADKRGAFIKRITIPPPDIVSNPPVAREANAFQTGFDITTSADVPATVAVEIKAHVESSSKVEVTNLVRKDIRDALSLINQDAAAVDQIKQLTATGIHIFVAAAVIYTDSVAISENGKAVVNGKADALKIGKYKIDMTFQCQDVLSMNGTNVASFFKATFVRYNQSTAKVEIDPNPIDLSGYKLQNVL